MLLAVQPGIAALVGWFVAMWSRQIGHFFFEPKDFDEVNQLTHERKEEIKVGYNLRRKIVLLVDLGAVAALAVARSRRSAGCSTRTPTGSGFVDNVALMWLVLGAAGLLFRTVQLFFIRSVQTGSSGARRSSRTRSTTCSSITSRRCTCCAASSSTRCTTCTSTALRPSSSPTTPTRRDESRLKPAG